MQATPPNADTIGTIDEHVDPPDSFAPPRMCRLWLFLLASVSGIFCLTLAISPERIPDSGMYPLVRFLGYTLEDRETNVSLAAAQDGEELFLHHWTRNDPLANGGDGLGPVCNANSCAACHFMGGVGGAGDVPDVMRELRLNTPALFGAGLIDRLSDRAIRINFVGSKKGKLRKLRGGIGRFGWSGKTSTLRQFVATASAVELGLSNKLRRQDDRGRWQADHSARPDLSRTQLEALLAFCYSLPRPQQVLPDDPTQRKRVHRGERVFESVGCADCHTPDVGGVTGIYTNFAIYNLEPTGGVGDLLQDRTEETPRPYHDDSDWATDTDGDREQIWGWQTPPLWGVADSAPYLHDGRAFNLLDAIKRHDGDGRESLRRFNGLSSEEKQDLICFLESLKAPTLAKPCPPALRGKVHIAPGGLMCY